MRIDLTIDLDKSWEFYKSKSVTELLDHLFINGIEDKGVTISINNILG